MNTQDQDLIDGEETIVLNGNDAADTTEDRGDVVTDGASPAAATPAAAEPGAEADTDADSAAQHIPKARFDAVYAQRKDFQRRAEEAEAELERLRARGGQAQVVTSPAAAVQEFDEDAAEDAYAEALLDGDTRKAAGIRREINAHIRTSAAAEARILSQAETELFELDKVSQQAIEDYPLLGTKEGEEVVAMIAAVRDQKIARGMPAHRALAEAVATIAPRFAPENASAPGKGSPEQAAPSDTRTRQALARGAEAANNQPPAIQAGLGNRTTASRVDVNNLTEEQFDALTPAELKKLRGD